MRRFLAAVSAVGALALGPAPNADAAGGWTSQTAGTTFNFNGVSFVDANHGCAVKSRQTTRVGARHHAVPRSPIA